MENVEEQIVIDVVPGGGFSFDYKVGGEKMVRRWWIILFGSLEMVIKVLLPRVILKAIMRLIFPNNFYDSNL